MTFDVFNRSRVSPECEELVGIVMAEMVNREPHREATPGRPAGRASILPRDKNPNVVLRNRRAQQAADLRRQGYTVASIAGMMGLCRRTVEGYLTMEGETDGIYSREPIRLQIAKRRQP